MDPFLVFPVTPGVDGNKITFTLNLVPALGTVSVSVSLTNWNRYQVELTVFYNIGTGLINIGTWADVAAAVNANPACNQIIFAEGTLSQDGDLVGSQSTSFSGTGVPAYYAAGGSNNYVNCGGILMNSGAFVAMGSG